MFSFTMFQIMIKHSVGSNKNFQILFHNLCLFIIDIKTKKMSRLNSKFYIIATVLRSSGYNYFILGS